MSGEVVGSLTKIRNEIAAALKSIETKKLSDLEEFEEEHAQIKKDIGKEKEEAVKKYAETIGKHLREMEVERLELEAKLLDIENSRADVSLKRNALEAKLIKVLNDKIEEMRERVEKKKQMRFEEEKKLIEIGLEGSLDNKRRIAAEEERISKQKKELQKELAEQQQKMHVIMLQNLRLNHDRSNAQTLNDFVGQLKQTAQNVQNDYGQFVMYFIDHLDETNMGRAERRLRSLVEEIERISEILHCLEQKLVDVEEDEEKYDRKERIKDIHSTVLTLFDCSAELGKQFLVSNFENCERNVGNENRFRGLILEIIELTFTRYLIMSKNTAEPELLGINETEVEEETRKGQDAIKNALRSYEELVALKRKELVDLNDALKENIQQTIEMLKAEGVEQVELEKQRFFRTKQELLAQKKLLDSEIAQLAEFELKKREEHKAMIAKINQEEEERNREHHEKMVELTRKRHEETMETGKILFEMAKQEHAFMVKCFVRRRQLETDKFSNDRDLAEAFIIDQSHEDFRRECKELCNNFNLFNKTFIEEESNFLRTIHQISVEDRLTNPPEIARILRSLRRLLDNLLMLRLDTSTKYSKFEGLREDSSGIVNALNQELMKMECMITIYCDKNDDLESDQGMAEKVNEIYGDVKRLIGNLRENMLHFNVDASTIFSDTLMSQFEKSNGSVEQPSETSATEQDDTEQEGLVEDAPYE